MDIHFHTVRKGVYGSDQAMLVGEDVRI